MKMNETGTMTVIEATCVRESCDANLRELSPSALPHRRMKAAEHLSRSSPATSDPDSESAISDISERKRATAFSRRSRIA